MHDMMKRCGKLFDNLVGFFSHWAWLVLVWMVLAVECIYQFGLEGVNSPLLPGSLFFSAQWAITGETIRGMLAMAILAKVFFAAVVCQLRESNFSKSFTLLAVGFFLSALILQHGLVMFVAVIFSLVAIVCRIPMPKEEPRKVPRSAI